LGKVAAGQGLKGHNLMNDSLSGVSAELDARHPGGVIAPDSAAGPLAEASLCGEVAPVEQVALAPRNVVGRGQRMAKRALDIAVAGSLLVILSPLFLLVAILIRRHDGGPVLYGQERIGFGGRRFHMLKFRSMSVNSDDSALRDIVRRALRDENVEPTNGSFKLGADPRVTPVGRWLRSWSIDELPQLLNVLRGDMSLVGPRPALSWETELFPEEYLRRADVAPGITGLWQVSGRSLVSTLRMLQYDVEYVDSQSLWLDVRILWRTIPTLIRGDGAR
jgi:lipopolysaccharide/colanic/teichoic acid biosynthesis glycosyltransferase